MAVCRQPRIRIVEAQRRGEIRLALDSLRAPLTFHGPHDARPCDQVSRGSRPAWLPSLGSREICFRGFIFKGLAESRLRWYGATLVTAILWAAIHLQYDWYGISCIFALGLLLGTARAKTNSTLLTMWLHSVINIMATVETAIALRGS